MIAIGTSVALYTIAFVHPSLFYWTMFVCFIPLFYMSLSATFSGLFYIVFWAVLLMIAQWWPLITIIIKQGAHPLKYCIPLFCLLLVAAGGLIVGLLSLMVNKYTHYLYIRVFLHTGAYWLFFEWIYRYLLITFGYTLSYPLLPLATHSALLKICMYVPMTLLMFCLLLAQMAVAAFYCYGNKRFLMMAAFCYAPFLYGLFLSPDKIAVNKNVVWGKPPPHSAAMLDVAQEIAKCIIDARDYDYLIFPESSFCYDCSDQTILELWQEYIAENQLVIIGTHVKCNDCWYVAACCLTKNNVHWHYKSFLLPCAEYVPWWVPNCFKHIFLQESESFMPVYASAKEGDFNLLICSEFFLSKRCWQQMAEGNRPIIVIVSDAWAVGTRLPNLMLLFARFKAIEWGRVIVYCSQSKFEIIT